MQRSILILSAVSFLLISHVSMSMPGPVSRPMKPIGPRNQGQTMEQQRQRLQKNAYPEPQIKPSRLRSRGAR